MISLSGLLYLLVWLVVAGCIYWLVTWLLGVLAIPEPFNKVIRVIVAIIAFVIVLNALLSLVGISLVRAAGFA